MTAVLLDLDGVLYEGERPIAGASQTVAWLCEQQVAHLFLTNTTSRPRSVLVAKLAALGVDATESEILTPPAATRRWLEGHVEGKAALFVPEATRTEFDGLPLLEPEAEAGAAAVVLGDLGNKWSFEVLNRAFRLLMDNPQAPLIALGMTRYWRAADGLRLDTAPFVVALAHATGREPTVLGKPAADFFEAALSAVGHSAADTIMVGDDIRGDIEAAQAVGIRGVLVRTGKFRSDDLGQGIEPHAVIDSIACLPEWWVANVPAGPAKRSGKPGLA